jgi:senataxin
MPALARATAKHTDAEALEKKDDDSADCDKADDQEEEEEEDDDADGAPASPGTRPRFPNSGASSWELDAAMLSALDERVLAWSERLLITLEDWQRASAHRERLEWAKQASVASGAAGRAHAREAIQWSLIDGADIVFSTLSSAAVTALDAYCRQTGHGFESVLVDEAAQAPEASTLIPLRYGCERCVLVGDPKQLPATVISPVAARLGLDRSLFARLVQAGHTAVLLNRQHRMHPAISAFPSARFYDGRLLDARAVCGSAREQAFHGVAHFRPLLFFNVSGAASTSSGRSHKNEAEATFAAGLLGCLMRWRGASQASAAGTSSSRDREYRVFTGSVAILTPYQGQLPVIRAALEREYARSNALRGAGASPHHPMLPTLTPEVSTVDSAQGREFDVVIFSAVRAAPAPAQASASKRDDESSASTRRSQIGFVKDQRRMNVALTRGRYAVWVLGDAATLSAGSEDWAALWAHAGAQRAQIDASDPLAALDHIRAVTDSTGV